MAISFQISGGDAFQGRTAARVALSRHCGHEIHILTTPFVHLIDYTRGQL
jgi:hypothetical protein